MFEIQVQNTYYQNFNILLGEKYW